MGARDVEQHIERVSKATMWKDIELIAEHFQSAVSIGLHNDPAFWKRVERLFDSTKNWDYLIAGMYRVHELRRHPRFLDLALTLRWPRKSSRVAKYVPYPHIHEIASRLKDLGYVPDDLLPKISDLSRNFPEFRALDLYLRRNGRYAFRMLITDPESLKTYLRFVHAWEKTYGCIPGKNVIEKTHKIFPDLHAHRVLSLRDFEDVLQESRDFRAIPDILRRDLLDVADRNGVLRFLVEPEDVAHFPRFLAYIPRYRENILPLPERPEDLFNYKFGHISKDLVESVVNLRNSLRARRMIVPVFDPQPLLQQLDDVVSQERLAERDGSFPALLRSAYEKIRAGKITEVSAKELNAIRSKKEAERLGLAETRRLFQKIVDRHAVSSGVLAVAGTVPEHFGALAASDSCYAPGHDQFTLGAVGTAGGPAVVFYVRDPVTGTAVAHQVYNLYRHGDRYFFVPNDLYGTDNPHLSKITRDLMEEHGLPVFSGDALPKGAHPAESRHTIRDFYSDVQSKKLEFAPYKRR